MKIYIKTYGCTANHADSRYIAEAITSIGHTLCDEADADMIIVNTCTVTESTEQRVLSYIRSHHHDHHSDNHCHHSDNHGKDMIVAGCLPAAQPEYMHQLGIDKFITPRTLNDITKLIPENTTEPVPENTASSLIPQNPLPTSTAIAAPVETMGCGHKIANNNLPTSTAIAAQDSLFLHTQCVAHNNLPTSTAIAAVNIATGCTGDCSYCIVKKARGELTSKPIPEIKQEVTKLISNGIWEIQLAGQDTACYGLDTGCSLPELLHELSNIRGGFRIRVGMMNPAVAKSITDELIEAYQNEKIYKFLHLPVQSGSDTVLEDMRRHYKTENYRKIISAFRSRYPDGIVSTDFIVGYPTERGEDFQHTLALLREVQAFKVNITRFSSRPHTKASQLKEISSGIKKERSRELTKEHHRIARQILHRYIGKTCNVTVTKRGKNNTSVTRDDNYRYIVIKEKLPLTSHHKVKITDAAVTYLVGERM
ncbi:MAG: tRNA-2-methylthio-N(6)-dimethylallyladenosine synthase [Candidatus Argoarchaeum ethanivorans]|uniref:tRNA-t(6)A37 methylthiotransferase n=1 Tax=Candidatus Argoarchaeum ethanivorans TaxID=2608793 RepID=A0A811TED1_9EURY|nr:MAG: tRNA-2-methylthio-N(6)-dimethylallyladenosine synthase [Candidatus Argoarchaeum ethanivorans]